MLDHEFFQTNFEHDVQSCIPMEIGGSYLKFYHVLPIYPHTRVSRVSLTDKFIILVLNSRLGYICMCYYLLGVSLYSWYIWKSMDRDLSSLYRYVAMPPGYRYTCSRYGITLANVYLKPLQPIRPRLPRLLCTKWPLYNSSRERMLTFFKKVKSSSVGILLRLNRENPISGHGQYKKNRVTLDFKRMNTLNSRLGGAFYPTTSLALSSDENKCARVCHGSVKWPCLRMRRHPFGCAAACEMNLESEWDLKRGDPPIGNGTVCRTAHDPWENVTKSVALRATLRKPVF